MLQILYCCITFVPYVTLLNFHYSLLKILGSASTANLYLNCVISYELFVLLRNNDRIVRHKPPTFQRVSLQAVGVYLFSVIIFCINYFVSYKVWGCPFQAECTDQQRLINGNLSWNIVVTYILPISFFFLVWITIKCRNYLPSITGKQKEVVSISCVLFLLTFSFYCTLLWKAFLLNNPSILLVFLV